MSGLSANVAIVRDPLGAALITRGDLREMFDETDFVRAIASALEAERDEMAVLADLGAAASESYAISLPTAEGLGPLIQEWPTQRTPSPRRFADISTNNGRCYQHLTSRSSGEPVQAIAPCCRLSGN